MIKVLFYKLFGLEDFPCKSCETLRSMLDISNFEKRQLLDSILTKPESVQSIVEESKPISNKNIPWAVRKQMLEEEDRVKAKLMREAPKPDSVKSPSLEVLEKELGINNG